MTSTPEEPLSDGDMETTPAEDVAAQPGGDADGTDGDAGDADGTDGESTDTTDGGASDSDGTDA